jgi:glucosamine--fructose-6-phosphate aminotransferase (isomerizing)
MCGIFGIIAKSSVNRRDLDILVSCSQQRGRDSSGLLLYRRGAYEVVRADYGVSRLVGEAKLADSQVVLGHSRLITNGLEDNQPVVLDNVCVFHNGIIVNHEEVWPRMERQKTLQIDTEIIAALAAEHLARGDTLEELAPRIIKECRGVVACALALPVLGKLCLFSNNGSLYLGSKNGDSFFASEAYPLEQAGCREVSQVTEVVLLDIPQQAGSLKVSDTRQRTTNLIPGLVLRSSEEKLLRHPKPHFRRCSKCLLPETMPFIRFDKEGVCNYCLNYKPRNKPRPKEELFDLVEPYRRQRGNECIVPFSGGRDSCYSLHLVATELKLKPIAYTYDWAMVTDLARRNISRMCADLGVENIIVADDITKKRRYIAKNLTAWLKSPHLGMVSILTAGDKHFFRHVETVKRQTGVSLNLWGVNPLEVTHFKAGFLGIAPDFEEKRVYTHGAMKQLRYQYRRFRAMLQSPGYFNSSLWDTLSGEYYRSFTEKSDYFHVFDYWRWDENVVDETLARYDWEKAPDTRSTWRIGDGTAAFYNYIYYTVAGFTEHDTFRSNQIREGQLTRDEALVMVKEENTPRYPNIKWYLDAVGVDFSEAIKVINSIPKLYHSEF